MADDTERAQHGEQATTSAPLTMWEAFPHGLRLELIYAVPPPGKAFEDLAEPFVPLGERGRFSRALAARVAGPGGGEVRPLALKMQSDDYPIGTLPGWTNDDVDAQWNEQFALVRATADRAAPALVDVLPSPSDGRPPLLPPTLFCKLQRAFFVAPCPLCGAPLHVCRDNALLESNGLPRYDRSLERFLYCASCHPQSEHRFYALLLGDPRLRERAPVGEQGDLFASLAKLAREGGALPCYGCAKVPTCYPASGGGDAVRYLTPLSFYDFRACASERLDLHLDAFVALLGGKDAAGTGTDLGGDRRRSFLFENDPHGRLPLEILRLKLLAFTQIVAAVAELHRATRRPHLALAPENIMVRLGSSAHGLPSLYRFDLRLLGIGTTLPNKPGGLDSARLTIPLLTPPPFRDDSFASALLAPNPTVYEGALSITGVSMEESGQPLIEADLAADGFDLGALSTKDALHINVRQGRPLPITMELLANPTRIAAGAIHLRSAAVRADGGQFRQLEALVGQGSVRAAFVVHRCLNAPADIESLGLLLFTMVAANAEQKPTTIVRAVRALSRQVADFQKDHPQAGAEAVVAAALAAVQRAEQDGVLAMRQLYWQPARFPEEAGSALAGYWQATLTLALRALTRAPGFGFCRAHDDFDPAHPEGSAEHLQSELDILGHRMDEELLAMQGKRREIGEAIRRVRQRLAGGQAGVGER